MGLGKITATIVGAIAMAPRRFTEDYREKRDELMAGGGPPTINTEKLRRQLAKMLAQGGAASNDVEKIHARMLDIAGKIAEAEGKTSARQVVEESLAPPAPSAAEILARSLIEVVASQQKEETPEDQAQEQASEILAQVRERQPRPEEKGTPDNE